MLSNALELVGLLLIAGAVAWLAGFGWGVLVLGVELVVLGLALDRSST